MNIKTLLHDEIQNELTDLAKIEVGTDEYRVAVDGITKLTNQLNDLEKSEFDRQDKIQNREEEYELKLRQIADEKKDRKIKNGIAIGSIVLPLAVAIWGTRASFRFEQEGTVTTTLGRSWLNKLIPKK